MLYKKSINQLKLGKHSDTCYGSTMTTVVHALCSNYQLSVGNQRREGNSCRLKPINKAPRRFRPDFPSTERADSPAFVPPAGPAVPGMTLQHTIESAE